jgi:hypothetical protein
MVSEFSGRRSGSLLAPLECRNLYPFESVFGNVGKTVPPRELPLSKASFPLDPTFTRPLALNGEL